MRRRSLVKRSVVKRGVVKRGVVLSLVVLAAAAATFAGRPGLAARLHRRSEPEAAVESVPTARVQRRSFDVTLRVHGELQAAESQAMVSRTSPPPPVEFLLEEGTAVKPGDTVIRLSTTDLDKQLADQVRSRTRRRRNRNAPPGRTRSSGCRAAKDGVKKADSELVLTQSEGKASVASAEAQVEQVKKEVEVAENGGYARETIGGGPPGSGPRHWRRAGTRCGTSSSNWNPGKRSWSRPCARRGWMRRSSGWRCTRPSWS